MSVAVLGCGISGLASAFALHRRGIDYTVFEAASRPGGVILTKHAEGYLLESGPNSFQPKFDAVLDILEHLRLGDEMIQASPASRNRYVVRNGTPHALPLSAFSFLRSPLFSAKAKLQLLGEPFRGRSEAGDESIASFVERRLGREFLDYAVDPFVGGIYAASADDLSARHAFPKLFDLERLHGSLVRGAVRTARARRKAQGNWPTDMKKNILSFRNGLQTLVDSLFERVSCRVQLGACVQSIRKEKSGWVVEAESQGTHVAEPFEHVISTIPLHSLPAFEAEGLPSLDALRSVFYAPVSIIHLGFDASSVTGNVDGFGVLIPSREPFNILGALFSSSMFPGRVPDGHVLFTVFVGGARQPELCEMQTESLLPLVLRDLRKLLGLNGDPSFVNRVDWPKAIPQYRPGYGKVKEAISAIERTHPDLRFAGNFRNGVSVADAMLSGWNAGLYFALPEAPASRIEPYRNPRNR